jgi:hypothetical protein
MEEVTVGSQTYDAYKIDYEGWLLTYYAPSVGNYIKVSPIIDSFNFELEMVATSYPTPNNPLKPDTPIGPTTGKASGNHEYQTRAVDPDGDQIMYVWDFTGDLIPDKWSSFQNSDENSTITYSWAKRGDYDIRVKARDINGLEGPWSDPLSVSMPRDRLLVGSMFLRILERFPNAFPLLRQKFGL